MTREELAELCAYLEATPGLLEGLAAGLSEDALRRRPAGGGFSFVEQAWHLHDVEVEGYAARIARILESDAPELADFDGLRIAAERDYNARDFAEAAAGFRAARRATVRAVEGLAEHQLGRTGVFAPSRVVTLGEVLEAMRAHDAEHRAELRTLRAALVGAAASPPRQ